MKIRIRHTLKFQYDRLVFLEPLTVRLRPRSDHAQRLLAFKVHVEPEPIHWADVLDPVGSVVRVNVFEGMHRELTVYTRATVETSLRNPFQYLINEAGAAQLPATYMEPERAVLRPYIDGPDSPAEVSGLANELQRESGADTATFLRLAVMRVSRVCQQINRNEGPPWPPGLTLRRGEGACRDLTIVFIALCRTVGLAARFVSGYQVTPNASTQPELHAWAEVYLPGGGWRGYDPSAGLATADRHVPVASAPDSAGAEPTAGTYRGNSAASRLSFRLRVEHE